MNDFVDSAMNETEPMRVTTDNDGETFASSGEKLTDLFFLIGSARNENQKNLQTMFERAWNEDSSLTKRILFWARDVRGGAGERQTFRNILKFLEGNYQDELIKVLENVPEFGRWDDLLIFDDKRVNEEVSRIIKDALDNGNGLCAKWMPRKGKKAAELRKMLGLSPKQYRKLVVRLTNVVESKMCDKDWNDIDFGKIPSVAHARYRKAFSRNASEKYTEYLGKVTSGEEKINAGAVFPHDVIKPAIRGQSLTPNMKTSIIEQWKALPNYLGEDSSILPVVDVSGSMGCTVGGNTRAIDVSVSLGLYLSEKQTGTFKDLFLTFSRYPEFVKLKGDIVSRCNQIVLSNWDMNTDIDAAFKKILNVAVKGNVPADQMPKMLLILSDMEFDNCVSGGTAFESLKRDYNQAGYEMPKVVFWNLNGRMGNVPVQFKDSNTALISGFSTNILKSLLSGNALNPYNIMLDTIMKNRYDIIA